jgi:starch-binding outer membrane protein, SusD/RagB family
MKEFIKPLFILLVTTMLTLASCSDDFLSRPPVDQIVADNFYSNNQELRMATSALYTRPWWDFNYPFIVNVGDVMSGNLTSNNNDKVNYLNFAIPNGDGGLKYGWSSLYNVIANANTVITNVPNMAPSSVSDIDKKAAIAEARFMRGIAYFYLVRLWGPVPITENSSDHVKKPQLFRNLESDVYQFLINDLEYAAENLREKDEPGRVTQWSAKGLLSKVYLTLAAKNSVGGVKEAASLEKAKEYAKDVIENSGLKLFPNYYDLFLKANGNNEESLFSLQWYYLDWGSHNMLQTQLSYDGAIADIGGVDWSGTRVSADLVKFFMNSNDNIRRKATVILSGDVYPELITKANPNGYTATRTEGGIKKYVIGGPLAPGNGSTVSTGNDMPTYMLRLADVYLIYAEAILGNNGSTSDPEALKYFKAVRARAGFGQSSLDAITSIDEDLILNERRAEFAVEHQYWFDLLRLYDYNPTKAIDILSAQHRNSFEYDGQEFLEPTVRQMIPTSNSFRLPLPVADVVADPNLTKEPIPYDFK